MEGAKVCQVEKPPAASETSYMPVFDSSRIQLEGDEDPRNWSSTRKWYSTAVISLMGFISPLGSSIVVPGGFDIDHEFHLHSRTLALLPVSVFVLGLGIGPFLLAPASELKGRHPIYIISSIVFVLFNLGGSFVGNFGGLIALRFLAGAAGSTGPSLGAGSIGDMFAPRERGRAQSLYGLGPLLGPVCGTIAGGWISQDTENWRWLLWVLTILSGAITVVVSISLRETYGPVLLRKKVKRMARLHLKEVLDRSPTIVQETEAWKEYRCQIEKFVNPPQSISIKGLPPKANKVVSVVLPSRELLGKLKYALSRPFRLLFGNPICAIFSLYMGYIYGIIFLFITQHPLLFQRRMDPGEDPSPQQLPTYNFREGPASLTYLGLGLGFIVAASINILLQDTIYARLVLSNGQLGWFLFRDPMYIDEYVGANKEIDREAQIQQPQASIAIASQEKAVVDGGGVASGSGLSGSNTTDRVKDTTLAPPPVTLQTPRSKGRPEYRLPLCLAGMLILPCGLLVFGWTAAGRTHFMVPLVGSFLVGVGSILPFQSILVYLVDAFIPYSASATACAVLVRCVLAAIFPLFAQQLFVCVGYGWGSTILAAVSLLGIPVPIILYFHGEQLRRRFKFNG